MSLPHPSADEGDLLLGVRDLQVRQFNTPCRIITVSWIEAVEDGDRLIDRAVSTPAEFDSVMVEYLAALNKAYRPLSETAPPTDVDELIAELKSALEELRIAGATPKCQRCDYPNCYCKPSPNDIKGSS
jgi:hypothetical protein